MSSVFKNKRIRTICLLALAVGLFGSLFFGCSVSENGLSTEAYGRITTVTEETPIPTESKLPTEQPVTPSPKQTPTSEPTEEPTETPTSEPTEEPTETPTSEPTEEPTKMPTTDPTSEPPEETEQPVKYVANTNTKKFHYPYCSSVDQIKPGNRWDFYGEREELIQKGYVPCKRCNP